MPPVIINDPGHGGTDPGAVGLFEEEDLTLDIALYRMARFTALGIPSTITREGDITVEPAARAALVRNSGARLCISDHINAGGGIGAEVYKSIHSKSPWADYVLQALVEAGQESKGVKTRALPNNPKKDYYFMHRETGTVETIIIEYGFIEREAQELKERWQDYAEASIKGTCRYLGVPYSPPAPKIDPLEEAVKVLQGGGMISSPEYWLENCVPGGLVKGEYAAILLQKMAAKIRGN